LPHGSRNCETNNATDWNLLPLVRFKTRNYAIKFVLCGTSISLIAFANQTEPSKRNSSEIDGLDRGRNPVNRGGMGKDCFDVTQVHSDGDRTGTFGCSLFPKLDQPFTIKLSNAEMAQPFVEKIQAGIFRPTKLLADFLKVRAVKSDKITHQLGISGSGRGRFLAVDPPLDVECPFLGILSAPEGLVDIFSLAADLGAPRTRL